MTSIIVAAITGLFSFFGIIVSSKAQHTKTVEEVNTSIALIQKDIKNLEKKQDLHNSVIVRMYEMEKAVELLDQGQKVANHRIDDLERVCENGK